MVERGGATGKGVPDATHLTRRPVLPPMEFAVLGWPPDGPTLRLDYRRFAYAGKFVMSNTGKAVARDDADPPPVADRRPPPDGDTADDVVAAVAFNEDRTDADAIWIRYVTVRADRRGEGVGPRLAAFAADRAAARGYDRVRIAVNNPFAYHALYRAGFAFTGEETGIAELVLERPSDRPSPSRDDAETYRAGLDVYRARDYDPDDPESSFLARKAFADPPGTVSPPEGADESDGADGAGDAARSDRRNGSAAPDDSGS